MLSLKIINGRPITDLGVFNTKRLQTKTRTEFEQLLAICTSDFDDFPPWAWQVLSKHMGIDSFSVGIEAAGQPIPDKFAPRVAPWLM